MSECLFLQEYDAEHLSAVGQLVERSIERLPYTLDVLLQVGANSTAGNGRLLEIFTRECEDWTCRNRGYFRGRRSASANPLGLL